MKRLVPCLALAAALAAAGCSKTSARPGARLSGPSAVAVFTGYTGDAPGVLRPYVAVANTLGDELRLFDAVTDKVVLAPSLVLALSVPTSPRPTHVEAGSLHDATPAADLLLVASSGLLPRDPLLHPGEASAQLQVISTWSAQTSVAATVDLGDVAPGAALESLVVAPVLRDDGAGGLEPTPGQAQVLVAMSDRSLVTIPAQRGAGGEVVLGAPVAQPLGFAPLDLALSPDGARLYAASEEPIPGPGGTLGVAELDLAGAVGARPVRALVVGAPTQFVMAADVQPFLDNDDRDPTADVLGPAAPRVYAAIAPFACGIDRPLPCGIAVVDPVLGRLAADPAGELPYQLPIQVPGQILDMAAAPIQSVSERPGLTRLAPRSGLRWTQAIAAVATTQGRVYLVDLTHFSVANDNTVLLGSGSARLVASSSFLPLGAAEDAPALGVWAEEVVLPGEPDPVTAVVKDLLIIGFAAITPGYTGTDIFTVSFQGRLPGLSDRLAVARTTAGGVEWVAVQESLAGTAAGGPPWRGVAHLYDPRLAIRAQDIVEVKPVDPALCPLGTFELLVTAHLPPSADHPGGALAVTPNPIQPINVGTGEPADPHCLDGRGDVPVSMSIRTASLVATSANLGYIGRPELILDTPQLKAPFELRYEDEAALSCPIMPDDEAAWPPAPAAVAACEADVAACRATCERLVLARRARRTFYVTDQCIPNDTDQTCEGTWLTRFKLTFPLPTGPVISFKVGTEPFGNPPRGAFFQISTSSGFSSAARTPYSGSSITGAVLPRGLAWHDRSGFTGSSGDGLHGFAAFPDNAVVDFDPAQSAPSAVTIR